MQAHRECTIGLLAMTKEKWEGLKRVEVGGAEKGVAELNDVRSAKYMNSCSEASLASFPGAIPSAWERG